ncbi:hypothetical protein PHLGIDRAFT_28924 [Phlebiopsis gigantea 11061_1 CR5-6]|uniref:N-terminal of MaoC-like dehydratase domain-containing protein n=1 Tax=Phlebiopsis gigantea (strain 11061_1 CR5-6) TaxID=745531 RepID=A0A0C3NVZ2_PHLG1|nr:hypothetical protein PHLGIDRAFT_28924 [Phlebiopsis gigantea 11061_1 CR5-6]
MSLLRTLARQRRLLSTTPPPALDSDALASWIVSEKKLSLTDTVHEERVSDLYVTLPTRDGTRTPYVAPRAGSALGFGHHLAFFHPRNPENALRWDGTDADFCPPEPFTRRMWAGGRMEWRSSLRIGETVVAHSEMLDVQKKGFDKGSPMVFVKQRIEYKRAGSDDVAILEERSHVYLAALASRRHAKQVTGMPPPDFSFHYLPSPTTLFRFSALTFNGHYIHLDKDYANSEGYSERLVHGPLTALMLLDATIFHNPEVKPKTFEYRALNPLVVNKGITIHGAWDRASADGKALLVWAVDDEDVVGMSGRISV